MSGTVTEAQRERHRRMQEAAVKLKTVAPVDVSEEGVGMAEAMKDIKEQYGSLLEEYGAPKKVETLKPSPGDPTQRNLNPMKCTKCQYRGEPAHDGKCKECGEPMVAMTHRSEDSEQDRPDSGIAPAPPQMMAPPPGVPQGPPPPPDPHPEDDDFEPDDAAVGDMASYEHAGKPRAGRVLIIFKGEAVMDTGYRKGGMAVTHSVPARSLRKIPETLFEQTVRVVPESSTVRQQEFNTRPVISPAKSKASKLIDQVMAGRRTADQAVKALLGK